MNEKQLEEGVKYVYPPPLSGHGKFHHLYTFLRGNESDMVNYITAVGIDT